MHENCNFRVRIRFKLDDSAGETAKFSGLLLPKDVFPTSLIEKANVSDFPSMS